MKYLTILLFLISCEGKSQQSQFEGVPFSTAEKNIEFLSAFQNFSYIDSLDSAFINRITIVKAKDTSLYAIKIMNAGGASYNLRTPHQKTYYYNSSGNGIKVYLRIRFKTYSYTENIGEESIFYSLEEAQRNLKVFKPLLHKELIRREEAKRLWNEALKEQNRRKSLVYEEIE